MAEQKIEKEKARCSFCGKKKDLTQVEMLYRCYDCYEKCGRSKNRMVRRIGCLD